VLLVCPNGDTQDRAHQALVAEAEKSPAFRERCQEAARRSLDARKRYPPRPVASADELRARIDTPEARRIAEAVAALPATR
jgi:beta-N-acetylhexosaminidase